MGVTIAITGINSYFASTLLPLLQKDDSITKIIGIDITPWKGGFDKVSFYREDVRNKTIYDILEGVTVVYHLAYIVDEIQDKALTHDVNVNGSRNVFKACRHNKIKKLIHLSSMTVYGSHEDNILGVTEDAPMRENTDSYYNSSKVKVERYIKEFVKEKPDMVVTIIRAGLLVGPNINNLFSKLWSLKVAALVMGNIAHNQFIHEDDLGRALHLAYKKDIPGIYNVTADDAVTTKWCFKETGAFVVSLPMPIIKVMADILFKLRLFPASGGWASVSRYTIFGLNQKFKEATGWAPMFNSTQAFLSFSDKKKKRAAKDNFIQSILSWVFKSGPRTRPTMAVLHIFKLGKIPGIRAMIPWMNHKKNSMTYLPVNKSLGESYDEILPPQIVHDFIDKASKYVIMDKCGCRLAKKCQHFTNDVGCLFMGESALHIPHGVSREVSREEAHAHVNRAVSVGLIPMTGKVRVDNFIFLTPDKNKLLSVCFCCHCCCMMTALKHIPGDYLDGIMRPIEGLEITVNENCVGCGTCVDTCGFNAIQIINGKAVHNDQCRGCGRCVTYCPEHAVSISINNFNYMDDVKSRIESHVDFA